MTASDATAQRTSQPSPAEALITAGEVAQVVGGELRGDPNTGVRRVASLDRAAADELSFLANARYAAAFAATRAGVVLVAPDLADLPGAPAARVIVARPHEAVLALLPRLYPAVPRTPGIHPTAVIGHGARIGADVTIGAYAVIGERAVLEDRVWVGEHCVVGAGVVIGADSRLFPGVTAYAGAAIGARVQIHAGARVGSDGFGYVQRGGAHEKIPHVGRCIVEDDVEIGANTTIDRGSVDDTVIGAGTKLDNLVHVAHNVRIGRLCLVMAQVGIAGSAHVGDGCVLAGQVGVNGHLTIGDGARLAAQAGVFGDIPAGETWSGYPARPHRESLRASAALFKLAGMMREIERLVRDRA